MRGKRVGDQRAACRGRRGAAAGGGGGRPAEDFFDSASGSWDSPTGRCNMYETPMGSDMMFTELLHRKALSLHTVLMSSSNTERETLPVGEQLNRTKEGHATTKAATSSMSPQRTTAPVQRRGRRHYWRRKQLDGSIQ
jgi:hypothetical protein